VGSFAYFPIKVFVACTDTLTQNTNAQTAYYFSLNSAASVSISDFFDNACSIKTCGFYNTFEPSYSSLTIDETLTTVTPDTSALATF
jgi:hypothetical protein